MLTLYNANNPSPRGLSIFFFSNEGFELAHVHVEEGARVAKFWLSNPVALASSYGFSGPTLTELASIVSANRAEMLRKWNEFFSH